MFRSLRAVRQSASLVSCIFQEPSLPGMDWIISWGERTTPVGGDFSSGVAFFSAHFCCCLWHFIEQSEPGSRAPPRFGKKERRAIRKTPFIHLSDTRRLTVRDSVF